MFHPPRYLTHADLGPLNYEQLQKSVRGDTTLIDQALHLAEATLRQKLGHRYDLSAEFTRTGADRHPLLVAWGADLARWQLQAHNHTPTDMAEARYTQALEQLSRIAAHKESLSDLPPLEAAAGVSPARAIWTGPDVGRDNTY